MKIGTVESVNGRRCKVRLRGSRTALAELTILKNGATYTGYGGDPYHSHGISAWTPTYGDEVVCLMIQDGAGQGFVLGAI
ncbi:MAG: hypothetical protein IJ206_09125 [Oscillospiraceae bacterium]|nr:hypothetical protein [Oscillospiraceae bacterium]